MNNTEYFESITKEISSMKNRIRNFIGGVHWQTDGEWKEAILRSILRRYLPLTTGVGKGFITTKDGPSSQIDILLYDTTKPILFKDGDFVLVTPDSVVGVIEVKTRIKRHELNEVLSKLFEITVLHKRQPTIARPFFGLFAYEETDFDSTFYLEQIRDVFKGFGTTPLHILSSGESKFIRFWECDPNDSRKPIHKWHAYDIKGKAPAYFLHNAIEFTCEQSVQENNAIWFPIEGKEVSLIGSIEMNRDIVNQST